MRVKIITKWQYTENRRTHISTSYDGKKETKNYESKPFRHTNKRVIFPVHKKGLLFKKRCDGSNVKRVIKHTERLYTQEEIDEIEDGHAQAQH